MLKPPTVEDLRDEVVNLTAHLIVRHDMTLRGLRKVVRAAYLKQAARKDERATFRVATQDDLLHDLEETALAIGDRRRAVYCVNKGGRLAAAEGL